MMTILPKRDAESWLELDQWRNTGLASMTGVGDDYVQGLGLVRSLEVHSLEWKDWLTVKDGTPTLLIPATTVFDDFLINKIQ